jgi:hypothetical protein
MPGYKLVEAVGDGPAPAFDLGDHVKLMFTNHRDGEGMWVSVTAIDGIRITGTLANTPICIDSLDFGDEVRFGPEHIIGVTGPVPHG